MVNLAHICSGGRLYIRHAGVRKMHARDSNAILVLRQRLYVKKGENGSKLQFNESENESGNCQDGRRLHV